MSKDNVLLLKCLECNNRNYVIKQNKKNIEKGKGKFYRKHCRNCLSHKNHKEIKSK